MLGLSHGDSNPGYADIDYALYPSSTGALYVYEQGVSKGQFGTYSAGDRLRVAVEGGRVRYRKNGALLYESAAPPQYPLSADTSFFHPNATVTDAVIAAQPTTDIRWVVADQLGTPRMTVDRTGSLTGVSRHDYLPFGEEIGAGVGGRTAAQGYVGDSLRQKFTSKERDTETGLDYFLARYYSSAQGRFTSPDEFTGGPDELYDFVDDASANPTFYADLTNPQSLNKYQYAYNNPLRYVDPDGHEPDAVDFDPQGRVVPMPPPPVPVPGAPPMPPPPPPGQIIDAFHENIIYPLTELGPIRAVRDMIGTNPAPTDSDVAAPNVSPPQPSPLPQVGTPPQQQAQPMPPPPPMQARRDSPSKKAAKEAFNREAGDTPRRVIRNNREGGTGRITGVGAGRASYRPKGKGRYSVTPRSGKAKKVEHFEP